MRERVESGVLAALLYPLVAPSRDEADIKLSTRQVSEHGARAWSEQGGSWSLVADCRIHETL